MKKILFLTIVCILAFPISAMCATISLKWDTAAGATGYRIDQSINSGTAWTEVKDAGNVLTTTVTAPDTGLVLYRIKAYNSQGQTIRTNAGAWFNGSWSLPAPATGAGIQ